MFGWRKKKKDAGRLGRPSFVSRWWDGMLPSTRRLIGRLYLLALAGVLIGGAAFYGMKVMERQVMAGQSGPVPTAMQVVLTDPPAHMPRTLLQQIAAAITPADVPPSSPRLADRVYQLAADNSWIAKVHSAVKRPGGDGRLMIVDVTAEYRTPVAKVQPMKSRQAEWVDAAGVRLPSEQVARYFVPVAATDKAAARQVFFVRRADIPPGWKFYAIHYVTIEGVMTALPPIGRKWEGDDLAEGLKLVQLVDTRKYANQIKAVDVRNFNGRGRRGDSYLNLRAQIAGGPETVVKFGRLPDIRGDWEVPTERKMYNLDTYVSDQKGYLAGTARYVDLRGDQLRFRPNDS